jgi:cysteine desulfuration protein SufE
MKDPPAPSIDDAQDRIIQEMAGLEDHLAKYEYLVGLGRDLVGAEDIRTEENRVPGCQSQVWIRAEMEGGLLRLQADSDALITRGIIALLLRVLDGHPPGQVLESRLYFLEETGLSTQLSPSRANGLGAMVRQVREHAARWETPSSVSERRLEGSGG